MYLPMSFHNCWEFNTIGYMYEREFILTVIFRIYNGHLTVGYANKWLFFNLPRFQMIGTRNSYDQIGQIIHMLHIMNIPLAFCKQNFNIA